MKERSIGASPGNLEFLGSKRVEHISFRLTCYDNESLEVRRLESLNEFELSDMSADKNYWLEVSGIHHPQLIAELCEKFGIHALIFESILDTSSQPCFEDLGDSLFTEVKVPLCQNDSRNTEIQQVSLVLKRGLLITFVEERMEMFDPLQNRLTKKDTRIRMKGLDYLQWAILDLLTDYSLLYIDKMERKLEDLETAISNDRSLPDLSVVHLARREVALVHRSIRPFREIANSLRQCESTLLTEKSSAYYNDLYSHSIQAVEMSEFLREHAGSLRELYFTTTSHRLNEVMKVLAGISVIFLPLSFLAGVYGMNFDHIPELHWKWGYQVLLGAFALIALTLFIIFKKKKWF